MSEPEKKPDAPAGPTAPADHEEGSPSVPPAADDPGPSRAREGSAPAEELDEEAHAALDEVDMRDLLRSALAPPPGSVAPELLRGVQSRLRRRSRGKFYGDGWSTARAPRSTYLFTSLLMLLLIGFVFLVLIPWGSGALP